MAWSTPTFGASAAALLWAAGDGSIPTSMNELTRHETKASDIMIGICLRAVSFGGWNWKAGVDILLMAAFTSAKSSVVV